MVFPRCFFSCATSIRNNYNCNFSYAVYLKLALSVENIDNVFAARSSLLEVDVFIPYTLFLGEPCDA